MHWIRALVRTGAVAIAVSFAAPSPAMSAGIVRTIDLDAKGLNMAMASEANGDLHVAWRAGAGPTPAEYCEIRYLHFSASANAWQFPSLPLVSAQIPCERGDGGQLVNGRVSENQPRVAVDPARPGRAFVAFAGSPAVRTQPTLVQVDTAQNPRGVISRIVRLGALIQEIKGVDLDVGPDGQVHVGYIRLFSDPSRNRIEVYRGASAGGAFVPEIATLPEGTGEGISVSATRSGLPEVAGTFRKHLTHASRVSLLRDTWLPVPTLYRVSRQDGFRSALGKVRFLPSDETGRLHVALIDALPNQVPGLGAFFYRELLVTELDGVGLVPQTPKVLHRYVFNNVAAAGGDIFSGEDLHVALSAEGKVALTYGIDGTVANHRSDHAVVLVNPPRTAWPGPMEDTNGDWLDDRFSLKSLDELASAGQPTVNEGADGRALVLIPAAETPAAAFSGERLWVAYLDQSVGKARVSEVELPAREVPELTAVALLTCLLVFGRRVMQPVRTPRWS